MLIAEGYYVPPIPMLAVAKDKPRLRFFLSASHTREQIVGALETIKVANKMWSGKYKMLLKQPKTAAEGRIPVQ